MSRVGAGAALALALGVGIGCQPKGPVVGGQENPAPVRRVVSLSPSTTEVVGLGRSYAEVVGRTSSCDYPPDVAEGRIVVSGTNPDFERIAQLKPDLIVYDKAIYGPAAEEKIKQLGFRTLAMDARDIDSMLEYCLEVGRAIGGESNLSKQVDDVVNARARAMAAAPTPKPRAMVLMGGGGADFMAAGTSSYLADVVRASGAEIVGPNAPNFVGVSPESILEWAPEIVFMPGGGEAFLRDARFASVPAVRRRAVFEVEPDVLLRASPRVRLLIDGMSSQIRMVSTR